MALRTPTNIVVKEKKEQANQSIIQVEWKFVGNVDNNQKFEVRFVHLKAEDKDNPADHQLVLNNVTPTAPWRFNADLGEDSIQIADIPNLDRDLANLRKSFHAQVRTIIIDDEDNVIDQSDWGKELWWKSEVSISLIILDEVRLTLERVGGEGSTVYRMTAGEVTESISISDMMQLASNSRDGEFKLDVPDELPLAPEGQNSITPSSVFPIGEVEFNTETRALKISLLIDFTTPQDPEVPDGPQTNGLEIFNGLAVDRVGLTIKHTDGTI